MSKIKNTFSTKSEDKLKYIFLVLPLSIGFYYLTLWITPYYVQYKIASARAVEANTIRFAEAPSPENNRVVLLPNPDFLYSTIGYDLSDGKILKVSGPIPQRTYWSISAYKANTTNYFVANDQQLGKEFEYYLTNEVNDDKRLEGIPKDKIIYSPTTQGLLLFRYLISKTYTIESLTTLQKKVKVEVITKAANPSLT